MMMMMMMIVVDTSICRLAWRAGTQSDRPSEGQQRPTHSAGAQQRTSPSQHKRCCRKRCRQHAGASPRPRGQAVSEHPSCGANTRPFVTAHAQRRLQPHSASHRSASRPRHTAASAVRPPPPRTLPLAPLRIVLPYGAAPTAAGAGSGIGCCPSSRSAAASRASTTAAAAAAPAAIDTPTAGCAPWSPRSPSAGRTRDGMWSCGGEMARRDGDARGRFAATARKDRRHSRPQTRLRCLHCRVHPRPVHRDPPDRQH